MDTTRDRVFDPAFIARLERLRLIARRVQRGAAEGEATGRRKGGVIEFAGHRDYAPGDDLRTVDWNVYGRFEKLAVKEYVRDERLEVCLLLDRSRSMTLPQKETCALRLAAAFACVALAGRNPVKLFTLHDGSLAQVRAFDGSAPVLAVLDGLASLPQGTGTNLAASLGRVPGRAARGSLVLVFSDFLCPTGFEKAVARLAASGLDVGLLHLLAPEEHRTPHRGPVDLVDRETGETLTLRVDPPLAEAYGRAVDETISRLRDFALSRGVRYHFSRTDVPVEDVLLRFLADEGWVYHR